MTPGPSFLTCAGVLPAASFVLAFSHTGYTTNLPLADFDRAENLIALKHDGEWLTPEHGWPARLMVPPLYFWKSAKWVRGIEFLALDSRGFWEVRGYHNRADPWLEERYSFQEEPEE